MVKSVEAFLLEPAEISNIAHSLDCCLIVLSTLVVHT